MTTFMLAQPRIHYYRRSGVKGVQPYNVRFTWFAIGLVFGMAASFMADIASREIDFSAPMSASLQLPFLTATSADAPAKETSAGDYADYFSAADAMLAAEGTAEEESNESVIKVGKGDTLLNMLVANGAGYEQAYLAVEALKKVYDPRNLRVGQEIKLGLAPQKESEEKRAIDDLIIQLNTVDSIELSRNEAGEMMAAKISLPLTSEPSFAGGTITSSLFQTGIEHGIPQGILAELVKAYSYDVDFQRQIQTGDQVEVLFDKSMTEDGTVVGYGDIHYAMLKLSGESLKIYHYKDKDGIEGYYNEQGESVVKALLKTPVNGARMSSGYGMRKHPILGYNKMHKGVDFAAPTGTPIYAAGDGVVTYRGRKGGYGNYVRLKHNDTYSTAYAHISRFAKGLRSGQRVKQGQVIAYVGSTGRSTGPHLHYEILKHGTQVNPTKVKFKTGKTLKGGQLTAFKTHIGKIERQIADMAKSGIKLASAE